ncbi:hypothetical protein LTR66_013813, partial [Elasticomyces elasticus]
MPSALEQLPAFGTAIMDVIQPTGNIFVPLVAANASAIHAVPKTTHAYGYHPRQELDMYQASSPHAPVLVFLYGGGLTGGAKTIPFHTGGIIYANLGAWFATRGYTTLV